MLVKILHLYNDIMNLYGEYGNIALLRQHLEDAGCQVKISRVNLSDEADIEGSDFIYMGSGTESSQKLVLKDFLKYSEQIKSYAESGKVMLFTGNAFELLGKSITDEEGNTYDALGLAGFTTTLDGKNRITGDVYCTSGFSEHPFVGFVNKCSQIEGVEAPLFENEMGPGNNSSTTSEGFRYKNIFGTHLVGPVLVKNPHFMEYIIKQIYKSKGEEFQGNPSKYPHEDEGYAITSEELRKRAEALRKGT